MLPAVLPGLSPPLPRIVLITDWTVPDLLRRLERCLGLGALLAVQHRNPGCDAQTFLGQARSLASLLAGSGCRLFVNGRVDVASELGCDLHLPARGLSPLAVRPHLASAAFLSIAVHDQEEAIQAREADFALVSPVFSPGSKPDDTRPPLGPEGFVRLRHLLTPPAFALGGIDAQSVARLPNDVAGLALVSAVWRAQEPERVLRALLDRGTALTGH